LAGFGNYGKNALIINSEFGPWMRFAVVVGDSLSDITMGTNAKVKKCIGVSTGFTFKEILQQAADVTIESVTELRVKKE
jgi:phosphoglycolate phosphatase-like HAD superfamily hydrolase